MGLHVHAFLSAAAVAVLFLLLSPQCPVSLSFVSPSAHLHHVLLFGGGESVTRGRRMVKERGEGECVLVSDVVEVPVAELALKMPSSLVEALKVL